jgi:hypothetical protein
VPEWWDRLPETPAAIDFRQRRRELNPLLRGRPLILVPHTATRDWRLFAAACDGAVRSLDETAGTLLELGATVDGQAAKWSPRATMRLGSPEVPIEFEVADG